tara:strand:- start:134 stop:1222 length:1089 start_codon:yes stop_codon:yes gene_type:complete
VQKFYGISVVIPIYNGASFVKYCFETLLKQKNIKNYEIIVVNDASTDNSKKLIEELNLSNLKIYNLQKNSGPSAARNLGLLKAKGDYVFFFDIDDLIDDNALEILYQTAKNNDCDYVFSDFKKIENNKNRREGIFNYPNDKIFEHNDIIQAMKRELHDASLGHLGLFGCNGRLIRRSLLIRNKIFFDQNLRWMEDKTFAWNVLSFVKNARYVRKQLYSHNIHPNVKTNVIESFIRGSSLKNVKMILNHIKNSFKARQLADKEISELIRQGLIFFSIQSLVTVSNSIYLKKVDKTEGKKIRRNLIKNILEDQEIKEAIKYYSCSNTESKWIPKAITLKSKFLLEIACDIRAKQIAKKRGSNKI